MIAEVVWTLRRMHGSWPLWASVQVRVMEEMELSKEAAHAVVCDAVRSGEVDFELEGEPYVTPNIMVGSGVDLVVVLDDETAAALDWQSLLEEEDAT